MTSRRVALILSTSLEASATPAWRMAVDASMGLQRGTIALPLNPIGFRCSSSSTRICGLRGQLRLFLVNSDVSQRREASDFVQARTALSSGRARIHLRIFIQCIAPAYLFTFSFELHRW